MRYLCIHNQRDGVLLVARLLMVALFILFGWQKVTGFAGTVDYMGSVGAPLPWLSAIVAVAIELGLGLLIAIGFFTRPVAILFAFYTVATAFIGHRYWTLTGMDHAMAMINFYKNVNIAGGFLLLAVTGPGRFSIDGK